MTDKQIIIDGVDVSECEWTREVGLDSEYICTCNSPNKTSGYCKYNPNCYYKQLKRKAQECEELKVCLFRVQNASISLTKQLDQLKEQLEAYKMEAEEGKEINAELKAENALLQMQIEEHHKDMFNKPPTERSYCKGCTLPYTDKSYKQAIEKIKEIAEKNLNIHTCAFKGCGYDLITKQILQICDEVNE